jgi:hypothetical protein
LEIELVNVLLQCGSCYSWRIKDIFLSASEDIAYHVKAIDPYIETPTPTAFLD